MSRRGVASFNLTSYGILNGRIVGSVIHDHHFPWQRDFPEFCEFKGLRCSRDHVPCTSPHLSINLNPGSRSEGAEVFHFDSDLLPCVECFGVSASMSGYCAHDIDADVVLFDFALAVGMRPFSALAGTSKQPSPCIYRTPSVWDAQSSSNLSSPHCLTRSRQQQHSCALVNRRPVDRLQCVDSNVLPFLILLVVDFQYSTQCAVQSCENRNMGFGRKRQYARSMSVKYTSVSVKCMIWSVKCR